MSILGQRVRETVGFSTRSVDEDVAACSAKLALLEKDVALLRKTLETASTAGSVTVPRARASMSEVLVRMGGALSQCADHYESFKAAHEVMDGAGALRLQEVFARVVIGPLDEWITNLAETRAAVGECDQARVKFDHVRGGGLDEGVALQHVLPTLLPTSMHAAHEAVHPNSPPTTTPPLPSTAKRSLPWWRTAASSR